MSRTFFVALMVLLMSGCGKSVPRDELEKGKPGYFEAKLYCTQCHGLPFADQHPASAWPFVIARMEGYMQNSKRRLPSQAEHEAILKYFQSAP